MFVLIIYFNLTNQFLCFFWEFVILLCINTIKGYQHVFPIFKCLKLKASVNSFIVKKVLFLHLFVVRTI
jgi:hypothetical protein